MLGDLGVNAQPAELAAELEAVLLLQADRVGGLVHQGTVPRRHHIAAQARVDRGACAMGMTLVAEVAAVVVSVTLPGEGNALAAVAAELAAGAGTAGCFVTLVPAVVIAVAHPMGVDAVRAVLAAELVGPAARHAVQFVPAVMAVVIAITQPRLLDTQVVVALHLPTAARVLVAIYFVCVVDTVVVTVTAELDRNAVTVVAL